MSTTDELLEEMLEDVEEYATTVTDDDLQFWIDEHLRVISIPKNGVVAGVEGDKNVNKIKFGMNRYYHDFDMSTFSGRILYSNAKGNKNYYNITDMQASGSAITFSWLVDADAVQYIGKTAFVVYLFKIQGSELRQKFFSTLATLKVLEGMEVDSAVPVEKQTDIIERMKEEISAYAEEVKKSLPADYTAMTEQVSSLKEDTVYLENSKKKYIISLSKNKEPSIEWSPSKPLAHNFTSNSDGFLKTISVTTKNSGKIKIYVLSNIDGKEIDNNAGYIVRSENIFDVVSGKNSISCDIRIYKGDTIAYHPVDGASVLYKDDPQGFETYQLNDGVYIRSGSHIRLWSIDFIIEANMGYQKCIDDVYKYSVSSNLIGMDFDTFYPVDFKEQNYITVSTKDGSIFPQSSETYIGMYDKNKKFIRNFRLNNTLSYRHVALRESDKDCAYIKWNGDVPVIECMVNYGIDILPYTVYFKNVKQNESDIKKVDTKVDTTDVNYIGNSTLVSKCMEFTNLFYGDYIVSEKTAPSKTESFLFFTDPHTVEDSEWENGCRNMLQTIKNYYDSTPTSFIVCGGDWLGNSDTPDKACYKLGLIKGFMDKLFSNNYLIVGNHDTNYQGKANESAETRTTRLSNDAMSGLMFDGKKAYYSFKGNYTTFYCFDTGTETQKLEDFNDYFWEQAIWFCESLIKNESEHIVIFMHILFYNNVINQMANQVDDIANKFNNRRIKNIKNIPYDFKNAKGKVEFILCGHNHADSNGLSPSGIPYAITKNAYPNGTPTFDMVMINYDNRIINLVRVGEGNSRKISMDTGELIN